MSHIYRLIKKGLLSHIPKHIDNNIQYEVMTGSIAYGSSNDDSDMDIYAFSIPPRDMIFPHLRGEIPGFGKQIKRFEQFSEHHIEDKESNKIYDVSVYNIVRYFQLCMECNPNMIDTLFAPQRCILHITKVGNMVREKRNEFLHKGAWHKFKGYSYNQSKKMLSKERIGNRKEVVEKYGYDLKFASNVIRLLNEIEQILIEGDLDLERNKEQLKSIRRGEWTKEQVIDYFKKKEPILEELYTKSNLRYSPDEEKIKKLLLECLEEHYGGIDKCIVTPDRERQLLLEIKNIVDKYY